MDTEDVSVHDVVVLRGGVARPCRLLYWFDQQPNDYHLTVETEGIPSRDFVSGDVFQCLCEAREYLRNYDTILLCNGARLDAYPSRMSRQMSGGLAIYISTMGRPNSEGDMVDLFGEAPAERIATVEEQRQFHRNWLDSLGKAGR